jgi:EAL domain-containing protein (putative c-di-GMP-specific phosphodiesterase class I)
MVDVEEAIEVMRRLREAGIAIAIDDFGTGYSSLSYLKRFPITTLKVDRSFVRDLTEGSQDAAIVLSTINLARSFGLEVVAEGVENETQLLFLQQHECDSAQGYHIARPLPAKAFSTFLDARKEELN